MGNTAPALKTPMLQVKTLDAHTVIVHGRHFPEEKLIISADMDMPHASIACRDQFTRRTLVKNGEFEIAIKPDKASDCDFRCTGGDPFHYMVTVETSNGTTLAEKKFNCVKTRRAPLAAHR